MANNKLGELQNLVAAIGDFLESGETSEGYDPDALDVGAVEEDGDVRIAVQALQKQYPSGKLPAPDARNTWRSLLRACRIKGDPYRRQNDAHSCADQLRAWATGEIDRFTGIAPNEVPDGKLNIDETSFTVSWCGGKPVEIGNCRAFWLLLELASSSNKYIPFSDLAERICDDPIAQIAPIKSRLVAILRNGGLGNLADCIKTQKGHYGLFLA